MALGLALGLGVGAVAGIASAKPALEAKAETSTYTYHFTNNGGWSNVYAYVWRGTGDGTSGNENTGWSGAQMTWEYQNEYDKGVYHVSFDLEWAPEKIIFHNNDSNQTGDIVIGSNTAWYWDDGADNKVGTWSFSSVSRTFYVFVNSSALTTNDLKFHAWNNNDDSHPMATWPGSAMTQVSGNIYSTGPVPCYYNSLIFNSDGAKKQTANLENVIGYDGKCYDLYGNAWVSLIQAKTQQWVNNYLYMSDYDPGLDNSEGDGSCSTYFTAAKANISAEIYAELTTNPAFTTALARYTAWALAVGESGDPSSAGFISKPYFAQPINDWTAVIVGAIVFGLVLAGTLVVIHKKRQQF